MSAGDAARSVLVTAQSVAINTNAASTTVYTPSSGSLFVLLHLFLEAEGATDVTLKSGSVAITGPVAFAANDEKEWKNAPFPVMKGLVAGDALTIDNSAPAQLNGWALIVEGNR